ncbi:MAG: uncharacterized protein A8A55_0878 [Amphiamblys sp. WSBS2006]|nr:MAG: uncharacterized protein A8A55_0878 [Amphiamblys sp. WSBS2006]
MQIQNITTRCHFLSGKKKYIADGNVLYGDSVKFRFTEVVSDSSESYKEVRKVFKGYNVGWFCIAENPRYTQKFVQNTIQKVQHYREKELEDVPAGNMKLLFAIFSVTDNECVDMMTKKKYSLDGLVSASEIYDDALQEQAAIPNMSGIVGSCEGDVLLYIRARMFSGGHMTMGSLCIGCVGSRSKRAMETLQKVSKALLSKETACSVPYAGSMFTFLSSEFIGGNALSHVHFVVDGRETHDGWLGLGESLMHVRNRFAICLEDIRLAEMEEADASKKSDEERLGRIRKKHDAMCKKTEWLLAEYRGCLRRRTGIEENTAVIYAVDIDTERMLAEYEGEKLKRERELFLSETAKLKDEIEDKIKTISGLRREKELWKRGDKLKDETKNQEAEEMQKELRKKEEEIQTLKKEKEAFKEKFERQENLNREQERKPEQEKQVFDKGKLKQKPNKRKSEFTPAPKKTLSERKNDSDIYNIDNVISKGTSFLEKVSFDTTAAKGLFFQKSIPATKTAPSFANLAKKSSFVSKTAGMPQKKEAAPKPTKVKQKIMNVFNIP